MRCVPCLPVALLLVLSLPTLAGEIHDAAQAGDAAWVGQLLEDGVDINERGTENGTALHFASHAGHLQVVQILLDRGADLELTTGPGRTALHLAALKGHAAIVQVLLERGAQVDPLDEEGTTPLGLAMMFCDLKVTELLIAHGADVNARFHGGATVLHALPYAQHADRHREMAALLIDSGADVNARTANERNTPLHMAAMFGDYDTAEVLIEAGADVASANAFNDRPLHSAAVTGQARLVALLLKHGARVDVHDASGMTALHWAAARGEKTKGRSMHDFVTWRRGGRPLPHDYVATARELLAHGASVDARDSKGRTVLKLAQKRGDPEMIALLEEAAQGVERQEIPESRPTEVSVRTCDPHRCWFVEVPRDQLTEFNSAVLENDGAAVDRLIQAGIPVGLESLGIGPPLEYISPIITATQSNHLDVVKVFLQRGGHVDTSYSDQSTLLTIASYHGYSDLVSLLLAYGADVNARDEWGNGPLFYASQEGHASTVGLLLENGANVNSPGEKNETALMVAARRGQSAVIEALLAQPGIDVNRKDARNKTALDYAKGRQVKALLIKAGARRGKEL